MHISIYDITLYTPCPFQQIWFSQHIKLPIVDVTATVRAVHQIYPTKSYLQNTYQSRRKNESMNYNVALAKALA